MEVNKDEAYRCIDIAEQCIGEGNVEKALRFLSKAEKLYSTSKAQSKYHSNESRYLSKLGLLYYKRDIL